MLKTLFRSEKNAMKRLLALLAAAFLALLPPQQAHAAPSRVVALAPSLAVLALDLGAGDLLVGNADGGSEPRLKHLPSIGSYARPSLERVARLKPDLCLAIRDGTPPETVSRLRAAGFPVLMLAPENFAGLDAAIQQLGHALGKTTEAERLRETMAARLARIDAAVASLPASERKKTLIQVQGTPPMFAGPATFSGELLRRAGGVNPLPDHPPYPRAGIERVLALQPEVIIVSGMACSEDAAETWRRIPQIPAAKNKRVFTVDADLFSQPSLRSLDALEQLTELLHPGLLARGSHSNGGPHGTGN